MSRDPQVHDHMKRKRYDTKWHQSVFDKPRWDAGELDFEKYVDEYVRKHIDFHSSNVIRLVWLSRHGKWKPSIPIENQHIAKVCRRKLGNQ